MAKHDSVQGRKKLSKVQKIIISVTSVILALVLLYCTAVFSDIPFIKKWRGIYIETAMTAGKRQWLATAFIPRYIINDVMKAYHEGQA